MEARGYECVEGRIWILRRDIDYLFTYSLMHGRFGWEGGPLRGSRVVIVVSSPPHTPSYLLIPEHFPFIVKVLFAFVCLFLCLFL